MSCYHPLKMSFLGFDDDGKKKFSFTGARGLHLSDSDVERLSNSPINKISPDIFRVNENDVLIPCGKCIGCRLDYSRQWADRLMVEFDHTKKALFFTLTYDPQFVTPAMFDDTIGDYWYTLVKKDLQDFNKRLRFHFSDKQIRFYACGEYGSKTLRPHYHGIYFGLSLEDFPDAKLLFLNNFRQPIYISDTLSKIWKNGNVSIGNVSWQSCAYVARYNLKKLSFGIDNSAVSRNCIPEFSLMSRRPGIGGYFPLDHPEFFDNPTDKIYLSDSFGVTPVTSVSAPKYILSYLELTNPELYATIKQDRIKYSNDRFLKELSNTDLNEFDYLDMKERLHTTGSNSLIRPLC